MNERIDLMGKILGAYLFPHPPIIIPEIGKGEEKKIQKTMEGVKALSIDIKEKSPSTIIIITPHGPLFSDAISISIEKDLSGNFGNFGHSELKFKFENNLSLVKKIINNSLEAEIMVAGVDESFAKRYKVERELDHGALVPLYFVDKEYENYKLIHITYGILSPKELYKFGRAIQSAIIDSDEEVVVIASGDLSHRLSNDGPYTYSPKGKIFDEKIIDILKENRLEDIVTFDLELAEAAGECGLRSLMIATGIVDGYKLKSEIMSYEGPFGVGYCTAKADILGEIFGNPLEGKNLLDIIEEKKRTKINEAREKESLYVKLARKSLEHYVKYRQYIDVPDGLPEEFLNMQKAVFVSLKKDDMLRGCIGTIEPTEQNISLEIIKNAVSAGMKDQRFDRVTEYELEDIIYSVDVLSEPEPIKTKEELDVKKYGIIVSHGYKKGLLLPNLEGVDTVDEQLDIALRKANIMPDENYTMERFEVVRYN
ncbi:AmmeMemoRadiSam system protein A [Tissierella carlieri]|uniref:AmmeMemoRadiSam system protein A n=1 Tax=Tissierella carlieri TaxID=689904 RepID=UPI001FE6F914|nr:AmmeMemoRadiSam system protein A [Tissierella carlieri]